MGIQYERVNACYESVLKCTTCLQGADGFKPRVGLILGSGLGGLADDSQMRPAHKLSLIAPAYDMLSLQTAPKE